jgi:hypothetical protein
MAEEQSENFGKTDENRIEKIILNVAAMRISSAKIAAKNYVQHIKEQKTASKRAGQEA